MMKEEYIRKIDAHRIALHEGGDVCAQKILELKREPVICITKDLRLRIRKMRNELRFGAEYGAEYTLLDAAADLLKEILEAEDE